MPPKDTKAPAADADDPDFVPPQDVDTRQLLSSGNPALIQAMQRGLAGMIGQSSGFLESLPAPIRARIAFLEDLQSQYDDLQDQFKEELKALEEKYKKQYTPLLERRRAVVTGESEAPANETEEGRAAFPAGEPVPAGIPDFWMIALRNHPDLEEMITEKDTEVLAYLADVSVEELEDEDGEETGFKLLFSFRDNPYFTDKVLSVTYLIDQDDDYVSVRAIEGCKIHWNADKDVTVKKMKKKPKPGSKAKPLTKLEPVESFFRFFTEPPQVPDADDDAEDEETEQTRELVEHHVGIGEIIRERIVPDAVEWFTGVALEGMDEEEEEGEEEEEEGEGFDDEEDEDEDSEDEEGPAGPPGAEGKEQPQECKQQ